MTPFGIYIHWPFCVAKCPYCDFNSHVRDRIDETGWLQAVVSDLNAIGSLQAQRPPVASIFFGGGTPSLMSPAAVEAVISAIDRLWPVAGDAEITLEANPNSVELERFAAYSAAGVNRVSIGVQSFDDTALKYLGRAHNAVEAQQAIEGALKTFPRVNFDLIYARPQQTIAAWQQELERALRFGTEHLSVYQLTIEQGTAFANLYRQGKLVLPDEELASDLYQATQDLCTSAGLSGYEISNHARMGAESRHNLLYWRYGDYAGVGPGAHGRLTLNGQRVAIESERLPERWISKVHSEGRGFSTFGLSTEDASREHLLMNLRLSEGIDIARFAARWGLAPPTRSIGKLEGLGLVGVSQGRLIATATGRLVLNRITADLADSLAAVES